MNTFKKGIACATEAITGKPGEILVDLTASMVNSALNRREAYREKARILQSNHLQGWQYNEVILKHFVKRTFNFYGTNKKASIGKIKKEIEHEKLAKNIILTGAAGSGKSTALKWLFMNAKVKDYPFLYLCASMFDLYNSLEDVLAAVAKRISKYDKCIVFFDGLDELKCVKGVSDEFDEFIRFFNEKSSYIPKHAHYRFVVATRPEHFAFHKMIVKKKSKKALDNYSVFEIQMLTPKESLRVCKTIEKLSKFDAKENTNHFKDKWPSLNEYADTLSKSDYLRLLKKYLKETSQGQSLLIYPLLCRYAYPIIREWSTPGQNAVCHVDGTQGMPIRHALEAYIKWEFHDNFQGHTESDEGRALLSEYKRKVFDFLTDIAGLMGLNDYISKEQWEELKSKKSIDGNASFCALQELGSDYMVFIHKSFKDYFLACYFANNIGNKIKTGRNVSKNDFENLSQLLGSNTVFCTMYTEQLLESDSRLIKTVSNYLLQSIAHNNPAILSSFVRGSTCYNYRSDAPFTVEEYLRVFPHGDCSYYGIRFNSTKLQKLHSTGILEINENENFENYKLHEISKKLKIRGIQYSPLFWKGFKHTTRTFVMIHNGAVIDIGGYWSQTWSEEDFLLLMQRPELQGLLADDMPLERIQNSEVLQLALFEKKMRDYYTHADEQKKIHCWIENIVKLIGEEYDYWCLFDKNSLHVIQVDNTNKLLITDIFQKGICKYPTDYIALYGQYKAITTACNLAIESACFCDIKNNKVNFVFDPFKSIEENNVLRKYYQVHWKNIKLLCKKKENTLLNSNVSNVNYLFEIRELFDLYKEIDAILSEFPNEKMRLQISDELLFTYYALGEGDQMVYLANDTLALCKQYNHTDGIELRKFLIADDTGFVGRDMEKLCAFAQDHIWI